MKLSNKELLLILFGLTLYATSNIAFSSDIINREKAARDASSQLIKQLGGALKKEMKNHGPEAAISVCKDLATKISGEISRKNGWKVTRVSKKVRNPLLGMPDAWERNVLTRFEERKNKGEEYPGMTFSELVEEDGVQYYRFMSAISTKFVCLTCHGDSNKIPNTLKVKLNSDYPMDQALGYRIGELRGAVSIKQPLSIPLL